MPTMAAILDKIGDDLLQLTLQLRNRKDADKQYSKFHGDRLIAVMTITTMSCVRTRADLMQNEIVPEVGLGGDLKEIFSSRNWAALKSIFDGFILKKTVDVCNVNVGQLNFSYPVADEQRGADCRQSIRLQHTSQGNHQQPSERQI